VVTDNRATPDTSVDSTSGVQVVDRIAAIFQTLVSTTAEVGIGDLSRRTGLSKATVHRLLVALEQNRFIEQNPETRQYRLGLRLFELGSHAVSQVDLVSIAQPFMEDLAEATGETTHLGVIRDGMVLYIAKVEGWHALRMPTQVGTRMPLHSTALGKVLLAHLSDEERDGFLDNIDYIPTTPNTITKRELLHAALGSVRSNGFAVDNEELEVGLRCIAAPIRNYTGQVIGAISVSGPTTRLTVTKTSEIAVQIVKAATSASERLGGPGA
jgi:DNA-binding IclR family transcriptional regulator